MELSQLDVSIVQNKYRKDGKVAVLYSPSYWGGWSTWCRDDQAERMLYDPWIVDILLSDLLDDEKNNRIRVHCDMCYPDVYLGGLEDLTIAWLPEGCAFRVVEHDGSEVIEIRDNIDWYTA